MEYLFYIILGVVVLWNMIAGYMRGGIVSLIRFTGTIAAYVLAVFYCVSFGRWIEFQHWFTGVAAYIAAGILIFIGVNVGVGLLIHVIKKYRNSDDDTKPDWALGLAVGMMKGALYGVILIWTTAIAIKSLGDRSPIQVDLDQPIVNISNIVMTSVVNFAVDLKVEKDSPFRQAMILLGSNPVESTKKIKEIYDQPELQEIFQDDKAREVLFAGDKDKIVSNTTFKQLADNKNIKAIMQDMEIVEADEFEASYEEQLADAMIIVTRKVEAARQDQQFQALANDEEVQKLLKEQDFKALLTNRKIKDLLEIILTQSADEDEDKVYHYVWRDRFGKLHKTDERPADPRAVIIQTNEPELNEEEDETLE